MICIPSFIKTVFFRIRKAGYKPFAKKRPLFDLRLSYVEICLEQLKKEKKVPPEDSSSPGRNFNG